MNHHLFADGPARVTVETADGVEWVFPNVIFDTAELEMEIHEVSVNSRFFPPRPDMVSYRLSLSGALRALRGESVYTMTRSNSGQKVYNAERLDKPREIEPASPSLEPKEKQ